VKSPLRPLALALVLSATAGCAHASKPHLDSPADTATDIETAQEYGFILNQWALMSPLNDATQSRRHALRESLQNYLLEEVHSLLARGQHEQAMTRLEHVARLYSPAELQGDLPTVAPVVEAANQLYRAAARTGQELQALFSLAIRQRFSPVAEQDQIERDWAQLERWVTRGTEYSRDPRTAGNIEQLLEHAAATFPTPWLTDKLSAVYLERYREHQGTHGAALSAARDPRIEFTGYLIARLYLRADAPEKAVELLDRIAIDKPTRLLRDMIAAAINREMDGSDPLGIARSLTDLIRYFEPGSDEHLPPAIIAQGWGIVENLSRRALDLDPKNATANLFLARSHVQNGLSRAAKIHYERALKVDPENFATWTELAQTHHAVIVQEADRSPLEAVPKLRPIEQFHTAANERWRDRPLRQSVNDAYLAVGAALYDSGEPKQAENVLLRSLEVEPTPEALDMLGSIDLRRGLFESAGSRYKSIMDLPYDNQYSRVNWEVRANEQLAQIAGESGNSVASAQHLCAELKQLNVLLKLQLPEHELAGRLIQRAMVFFYQGDNETAMVDFRQAASTLPSEAGVYADPLLFAIAHGNIEIATEIYTQARGRSEVDSELKLYFSLWLHDLSSRTGRKSAGDPEAFIEDYKGSRWHNLLARHSRGIASYQDLLDVAQSKGQRAEAHFYEGLRAWREGAQDRSLDLMAKVIETGMLSFFEFEMAQHYVRWQRLPKTIRAPFAVGASL